jgi:hypothetical protein|tara:strand:+ start:1045 stop:1368 length:324 start_codon:yes stop_codon:yes gene_type:complete
MTFLEIGLIFSNILLLIVMCISVRYHIKHGIIILQLTEAIEDVLDVLDEKYTSISKVLEIPLFYDSPQIRGVVDDVRECRDSLLKSANMLTDAQQEQNEEKEDNQKV